jgi:hypothetical protein
VRKLATDIMRRRRGLNSMSGASEERIGRRSLLKLGAGAAVGVAAVPIIRSTPAGATTLSSEKSVVTLTANQTSITLPSDSADQVNFSTNAAAGGSLSVAISGSPVDGQALEFQIKSANPENYAWPSSLQAGGFCPLPATTSGSSLIDYFLFAWRASGSCWDVLSNVQGID